MTTHCLKLVLIALLAILVTACGNFLKPHRITIQQGNIITWDMLDKLDIGMSKRQVEYVLGTPLIVDTFEPGQWHYIYYIRLGNGNTLQKTLKVSFTDDKLTTIDSDYDELLESQDPNALAIKKESEKLERTAPQ